MNAAVLSMLSRYNCVTKQDFENALKEIMQEIALLGLWRSKFFEHATFYGGTSLRILYGLDRFSEDLDFSLLKPQEAFTLSPYLRSVEVELKGMGFSVTVDRRDKIAKTATESAFLKAGTRENLIKITVPQAISNQIEKNRVMTVKFEVDTNPPGDFNTEAKTLLQPIPFSVNTYRLPDLFAGKIHAVLARPWRKPRVKGRDYYDFVWYVARGVPVHLGHLEQRLRQCAGWELKRAMKPLDLMDLLQTNFAALDVDMAKKDVEPFLRDQASVALWSRDFFESLLPRLKTE
jgi:predicted nucleotidyltransferase component of viral defense system